MKITMDRFFDGKGLFVGICRLRVRVTLASHAVLTMETWALF